MYIWAEVQFATLVKPCHLKLKHSRAHTFLLLLHAFYARKRQMPSSVWCRHLKSINLYMHAYRYIYTHRDILYYRRVWFTVSNQQQLHNYCCRCRRCSMLHIARVLKCQNNVLHGTNFTTTTALHALSNNCWCS